MKVFDKISRRDESVTGVRRAERERGTILIFVVAILALLAVMGTAYLLMARMDRTNTRIESEAINMDYGRDAILNMAREIMFDSTLDASGNILNRSGSSQYYDYPGGTEAWLTAYGPNYGTSRTVTAASALTPKGYDPSTNAYDITLSSNAYVMTPVGTGTNASPVADGEFQLLSFSTPSGVRFRFALDVEDSNSRANLNVGSINTSDSDASGIDPLLPYGAYYSGVYMGNSNVMASGDSVSNIHYVSSNWVNARGGVPYNSVGTTGAYNLPKWLITTMTLELPNQSYSGPTGTAAIGEITGNGTTGIQSGSNSTTGAPTEDVFVCPYDLADEMELRSFGIQGLNYIARPATVSPPADQSIWPNTTGENQQFRDLWTCYSWTRNYRGSPDPATGNIYTFNQGEIIWPTYPRKIGINPNVGNMSPTGMGSSRRMPKDMNVALGTDGGNGSNYIPSQAETLAITAVNIATAMRAVGYTAQEQLSFAANYMTYRSEQGAGSPVRYISGPAWIDASGIHIPVYTNNSGTAGAIASFNSTVSTDMVAPAGTMYMGYIAQPFLTQVVSATGNLTLTNTYPYALDLTDYRLLVNGAATALGIASVPAGSTATTTVAAIAAAGAGTVQLQRTYNSGSSYYTVDSLAIGGSKAAPSAPLYDRYNDNTTRVDGHTHIPLPTPGGVLYNITDFNRIGRMCNIVTSSGTDQGTCISAQSPTDSTLHFDFLNDTTKAVPLLDYIDTANRADDPTIVVSPGMSYWDISKLRLPGRINVNTAMASVLQALPGINGLGTGSTIAASIISHRPMKTMSDVLSAVQTAGASSIDARDQVWGDIFNACTTRSDTFVVYGYMEAVRANPAAVAAGTFNNSTGWYDTVNVTEDPNVAAANSSINLIRVSKRRFLAVIDRSFSNLSRVTATNAANGSMNWASGTAYVPGNIVVYPPVPNGTLYQCVPPLLQNGSGAQATAPAGTPPTTAGGNYQGPYYFVPVGPFQLPRVVALKDMPY